MKHMCRKDTRHPKGRGWRAAGLLFLLAALCLTGYNLWDEYRAGGISGEVLERISREREEQPEKTVGESQSIPDYLLNPDMEMPTITVDGKQYIGVLTIPALNVTLPVMESWSYPNLKISPNRYQGSAYTDNLIIAGHNYRTHFGRLNNLSHGDEVTFTDVDGNRFVYTVVETEVLHATETERMEEGDWDLTLFTCTLSAADRVTVRCERVMEPGQMQ